MCGKVEKVIVTTQPDLCDEELASFRFLPGTRAAFIVRLIELDFQVHFRFQSLSLL